MPAPYNSTHSGVQIDNAVALVLASLSTAAALRSYAELGDAATKDVGTSAGDVAAGDDSRITGALQADQNLSDLDDVSAARTALGAGSASGLATLDGSGKVPTSQLPASVLGGVTYQGTWNANTNSPALASGVGTVGHYYKVSVAGTTTIDGVSEWNVGDMIVFDGSTWDKIDNTEEDATSTVNGRVRLTRDLGNTAASPQVTGLQGEDLPAKTANKFVKRNSGNSAWENVGYGSTANSVCEGNDSRLSDTRTPTDASVTDAKISGTLSPSKITGTAAVLADLSPSPSTLTDAATVTWAVSGRVANAVVTLGGARALDITGASAGYQGVLIVKQDATGGRTLTLPSGSKVANAGAGAWTPTAAANAVDIIAFYYDGTNYWWTIASNFT